MSTLLTWKACWWRGLGVGFLCLFLLLGILGAKLYNQPLITVGSVARSPFIAPMNARIIDQEATELARENARQRSIQIFQNLSDRDGQIIQRLEMLLQEGDSLFASLGVFPYLNPALLTTAHQQQLQALTPEDWQALRTEFLENTQTSTIAPELLGALQKLRNQRPLEITEDALLQIEAARLRYITAERLLSTLPAVYNQALALPANQWPAVRQETLKVTRQLLAIGVIPGMPEELRLRGVYALLTGQLTPQSKQMVGSLVIAVLEPNLKVDRLASLMAADSEAETVSPVFIPIRAGQLLVPEGQRITPRLFSILDQLNLTERGVNWLGLTILSVLLTGSLSLFCVGVRLLNLALQPKDLGALLTLAVITAVAGVLIPAPWTQALPVALLGLLAGNYYGSRLGFLTVVCLTPSLLYSWSFSYSWAALLPVIIGGMVAALSVDRVRSRAQIALAGIGVGLVQGTIFGVSVLASQGFMSLSLRNLVFLLLYVGGGLVWSIVALGVSPYLEAIFDVITPVRLAELSNPNCGLLKKLVTEAPGTYQHTQFVANLATAAAQALGDNADLVRVGTLYHDIGKMRRPQYFIENQMGLANPHDQMDDPWRSAEIIRDHVNDGLEMAKKYNLPKVIRDFIPEHQGTILIAFFYHQAKEQAVLLNREVLEEDFRYQGPIPQSRETGLVMLADACEAALRSLNQAGGKVDPYMMVRRILQARWDEKQLVDSKLREEELDFIACTFIKVWKETNHRRIRYPNQPGGMELRRRDLVTTQRP